MGGIPQPRIGSQQSFGQRQHRRCALQRQARTPIHCRNADDVDLCLQTARTVQCLEGIRQSTGKGRRLRTAPAGLLAELGERHLLRQRRLLPRLPDCGSGRNQASHRRSALYLHRTTQIHTQELRRQENAGVVAPLPDGNQRKNPRSARRTAGKSGNQQSRHPTGRICLQRCAIAGIRQILGHGEHCQDANQQFTPGSSGQRQSRRTGPGIRRRQKKGVRRRTRRRT